MVDKIKTGVIKNPASNLKAGPLSYDEKLCGSNPAYTSNSFYTGQFFIKQLKALQRASLRGTHQNASFNAVNLIRENAPLSILGCKMYSL
jgi:hypothetical protein